MAYDSAATRARLLDAAYAEFSERGLAGARVDRLAAEAGANKQAIYLYFGSKDGLFDAVLESRLGILADLVPFTPTDLPAYVVALFDHLVQFPELLRLTQWKALERSDVDEREVESHVAKAKALAEVLGIPVAGAMDLLMLCLSMAQSWVTTSGPIRDTGGAPHGRLVQHRAALLSAAVAVVSSDRPAGLG